MLKALNLTVLIGLTSVVQAAAAVAGKHHLNCQKSTRTYVSKVYIEFDENYDELSWSFYYSYDLYKKGPIPTSGRIASSFDRAYPVISSVDVVESGKLIKVYSESYLQGGRNPHRQSVELEIEEGPYYYDYVNKLIINGKDYTTFVGGCYLDKS